MATNFPTSLDALTNPTGSSSLTSPDHASQHANANDAIEALQAKVGVNGSAVTTSLDYRVGALESTSAFRNKLINGDFSVNQRGVTSVTTSNQFGPDRWRLFYFAAIAGVNYFLETGPLLGFSELQACKGYNCLSSMAPSNLNYMYISQRIEDARTLAGQTVCLSFYATNFATVGVSLVQNFGTGGSPSAEVATSLGTVSTFPGSRSYVSATLPNVQSKTFGTNNNSYLELRIFFNAGSGSSFYAQSGNLGDLYNDVTITGVQLERGSVPTAYDKRPQQTELALCQRYYWRMTATGQYSHFAQTYAVESANVCYFFMRFPVTMRVRPSSMESANIHSVNVNAFGAASTVAPTYESTASSADSAGFYQSDTGKFSTTTSYALRANNNTGAYVAFNAEF